MAQHNGPKKEDVYLGPYSWNGWDPSRMLDVTLVQFQVMTLKLITNFNENEWNYQNPWYVHGALGDHQINFAMKKFIRPLKKKSKH